MLRRLNYGLLFASQEFPFLVCDPDGWYVQRDAPGSYELEIYCPMWKVDNYLFFRVEVGLWFPFYRIGPKYGTERIGPIEFVRGVLQEAWEFCQAQNGLDRWGLAYQGERPRSMRYVRQFMELKKDWMDERELRVPHQVVRGPSVDGRRGARQVSKRPVLARHRSP